MKKQFYMLGFFVLSLITSTSVLAQEVELNRLGGYSSGVFDEGAAEIVSYDKVGEKLYFVNADAGTVGILDISDPASPTLESTIDVASDVPNTGGLNAVAVGPAFFAVAVEHTDKQANGYIAFYDLSGSFITQVDAGALPDNIQVSPDGNYVMSANEGEPNDDYDNDPEGSVTLVEIPADVNNLTNANATTLGFTQFNGQTFNDGTRIFGPNATVAQDLEPEYIAFSSDSETAYVVCQENNTIITVDVVNGEVLGIQGLGYKDHSVTGNGFDASNRSDDVDITTHPTLGMYQPDAMVVYNIDGVDYLFTANEGDARDYDGYSEEVRVDDLTLDSGVFPDAADLQMEENLGRLKTTTATGDADADGDFEEIYSYGARSFSIWRTSDLTQVFDSGDDIEQQVLLADPDNFNSTNDDNDSYKNRSDDKGPEPEAIDVGTIADKHYAFVGLERMGGVMVYDVTNVNAASFVNFTNNRNFDVEADSTNAEGEFVTGDLAPECIVFIPAGDHSSGKNLLVVSNEVTGSISIYEVAVDGTSSVGPTGPTPSFTIFPNPASDRVKVSKVGDYEIFNTAGQPVLRASKTNMLNVSGLTKGMYYVKGAQGIQKLIVQ